MGMLSYRPAIYIYIYLFIYQMKELLNSAPILYTNSSFILPINQ